MYYIMSLDGDGRYRYEANAPNERSAKEKVARIVNEGHNPNKIYIFVGERLLAEKYTPEPIKEIRFIPISY